MESYLLILLISIIIIYKYFNESEVIYIEYYYNNIIKKYLVRNKPDKDKAVETLYNLEMCLINLINKLDDDKSVIESSMYKYLKNLKEKIKKVGIQETPENSNYTSYSVNKGELLVFCIRSKKTGEIHNINELKYVAIHELAHIACPEIGHTSLFFDINKYLLNKAIEYNLYEYIDYNKETKEYCGMELNINIASK